MPQTNTPRLRVAIEHTMPGLPPGVTILSRDKVTYTYRYTIVVLRTPGAASWMTAAETNSWDVAVNLVSRELAKGAHSVSVVDNGDPDPSNGVQADKP